MNDINLLTWFGERNLLQCPNHFVRTQTEITDEKLLWIYEKLKGRFSLQYSTGNLQRLWELPVVYFEDPQEAVVYELTWS